MREWLQKVSLQHIDNQTCTIFWWEIIWCKNLPYTIEEMKSRRQQSKELSRLQKKYSKLEWKLDKTNLKRQNEKITHKERIKEEKLKLSLQKKETKLHKTFVRKLLQRYGKNLWSFSSSPGLSKLIDSYSLLSEWKYHKEHNLLKAWWVAVWVEDITTRHAIREWKLPMKQTDAQKMHHLVTKKLHSHIGNFKEYIYSNNPWIQYASE
jgi:hypothetical protein